MTPYQNSYTYTFTLQLTREKLVLRPVDFVSLLYSAYFRFKTRIHTRARDSLHTRSLCCDVWILCLYFTMRFDVIPIALAAHHCQGRRHTRYVCVVRATLVVVNESIRIGQQFFKRHLRSVVFAVTARFRDEERRCLWRS